MEHDPSLSGTSWIRRRERFYERALGPVRGPSVYHWPHDVDPHVDVYLFGPVARRPHTVLVTGGLADRAQTASGPTDPTPRRVEVLLRLAGAPADPAWAAWILRELSRLPFDHGIPLLPGTIVDGSRSVHPESLLRDVLLLPAAVPGLRGFLVEGEEVSFLEAWLLTPDESRRALRVGPGALVALLRERGAGPLVRLRRASVL